MLPFNVEPMPMLGLTPAEQAQRQRQRMLQAGVFVCCLLLLLDTNQQPSPNWRKENSASEDPAAELAATTSGQLDEILSRGSRQVPANITGYYNGDWAALNTNLTLKSMKKKKSTNFGAAVIQLEMIPVLNLRSVSMVRGLLILAEEVDTAEISVSAFGLYFHSLGRVALVANVGSPYTELVLEWTKKRNESQVSNFAEENLFVSSRMRHRERGGLSHPNLSATSGHSRRRRNGEASHLVSSSSSSSGQQSDFSSTSSSNWGAFETSRATLRRRLSLREIVAPHPPRADDDSTTEEDSHQLAQTPGVFASSPPAPPPGDEARTTVIDVSSLHPDSFTKLDLVLRTALPESVVSKRKPALRQTNFSLPLISPLDRDAGQLVRDRRRKHKVNQSTPKANVRRRLRSDSSSLVTKKQKKKAKEDIILPKELPVSGSIALQTAKPLAYTIHPFLADVWRGGKCALFLDLEESMTERANIKASTIEKHLFEELAGRVVGRLYGCGIEADISVEANRVDWDAARSAAFWYSFLMTTVCLVQIGLLFRQLHFSRTQAVAARVSLLCVAAQSLIDAVLCVANLLLCAVVQNLFAAFAAVAFFELVVFCVVEMRYVVVVFQAHDPQRFWLQASTRRQLAVLHAQFYFALFAALCAVYASRDDIRLLTLVAYSFWFPQIIRNARYEFSEPFHDYYLYGIAITRLLPPLYVYAYPYSLVSVIVHNAKLRPLFCLLLIAWQAAQVAILKAQKHYGPRFFIPSCFLPARYDYRRPLPPAPPRTLRRRDELNSATSSTGAPPDESHNHDQDDEDDDQEGGYECSICFQNILPEKRDYLITPCDHVFHAECLLQWMNYKAECPVCRSTLPPS